MQRAVGGASGVALAVHIVRSWQAQAEESGGSWLMVFVDIERAFDSVLRQQVFGASAHDLQMLHLLYMRAGL
eukprot:12884217-Prorocentrum_lima.AAC.1